MKLKSKALKPKTKVVQSKSVEEAEEKPKYAISDDSVLALIEEKQSIDQTIKTLDARKKEIVDIIKNLAEAKGVKNDKGSFVFTIRTPEGVLYGFEKNRRASVSFNQSKAIAYLKANYPKLAKQLINHESIEVVAEDDVKQAVMQNKLKVADLNEMIDSSESFAGMMYVIKEDEEELQAIADRKAENESKVKASGKNTSRTPSVMPTIKVSSNKLKKRGGK